MWKKRQVQVYAPGSRYGLVERIAQYARPVVEKGGPGALPPAVALSRNISSPQVVLHETK